MGEVQRSWPRQGSSQEKEDIKLTFVIALPPPLPPPAIVMFLVSMEV